MAEGQQESVEVKVEPEQKPVERAEPASRTEHEAAPPKPEPKKTPAKVVESVFIFKKR